MHLGAFRDRGKIHQERHFWDRGKIHQKIFRYATKKNGAFNF